MENEKLEYLLSELLKFMKSGERDGFVASSERIEGEPTIGVEFPRGERFFITVEAV